MWRPQCSNISSTCQVEYHFRSLKGKEFTLVTHSNKGFFILFMSQLSTFIFFFCYSKTIGHMRSTPRSSSLTPTRFPHLLLRQRTIQLIDGVFHMPQNDLRKLPSSFYTKFNVDTLVAVFGFALIQFWLVF